ncbi:MAG: type II secretion system F family protein [Propionibacteriaceae bacterium]|jgi:hypothetical protein|nr:type II secretion system F family protein [Propionibacteriaceae bacterium]
MTGLQLSLLGGLIAGCGFFLLLVRFRPVHADLTDALRRLAPGAAPVASTTLTASTASDRLGAWALRHLPARIRPVPASDLALLGLTPAVFLGRKVGCAIVGLIAPGVLLSILALMGAPAPWGVPVVATVALAGLFFVLPDLSVAQEAAAARVEFTRALSAYIDLVALERACGSGPRQALETAAQIGDSWAFRLIGETLTHATWAGEPPWEGLKALAERLELPELADIADIMRVAGSEGAQIYRMLRARTASMRAALLTDELAQANEASEKMSIPVSALGIVFLAILVGPSLLSMSLGL